MEKITKQDIINNKQNCILIPMYSIILSIVYVSWVYYSIHWLWLEIILPFIFVGTGLFFTYSSTLKKKHSLEKETKDKK